MYWRDYQLDDVPTTAPRSAADVTALVLCDISRNLNHTLEGLYAQDSQGFDLLFYDTYDHTDPGEAQAVRKVAAGVKTPYTLLLMAGSAPYPYALSVLLAAQAQGGEVLYPSECYVNRVDNVSAEVYHPEESELYKQSETLLPMTLLLPTPLLLELLDGMVSESMYHVIPDVFLKARDAGRDIRHVDHGLLEISVDMLVLSFRDRPLPFEPAPAADIAFVVLASDGKRAAQLAGRLARGHSGADVLIAHPEGMRLGARPGSVRLCALPANGLVAGLEQLLPTLGKKAVVLLQDSINSWDKDAFTTLAGCVALDGVAGVSPLLYDTGDKILYAGATTAGAAQYYPLFRKHGRSYAKTINIVNVVREIGVLNDECLCLSTAALGGLLPLTGGIASLREWVVELSLKTRAQNNVNVYCGKVQLCSVWDVESAQNGLWGSGTGHGICRWFRLYAEEVRHDSTCPFGVTRGDTHIGPSMCITDPGNIRAEGSRGRVLAISHEMTLTGAPLVLVKAMRLLQEEGFDVVCVAPKTGPMHEELLKLGISVIIDPQTLYGIQWRDVGPGFDLVLPNTILPYQVAQQLSGQKVPVLWWVHDAEAGYPYYDGLLPKTLEDNVHVYCTGGHALNVLLKYRPSYNAQNLFYGIEDLTLETGGEYDLSAYDGKLIFTTVGSMEYRKGPDIFADAIGLLPPEVRRRCVFLFVGRAYEPDMVAAVRAAEARYPEVHYIENIPRKNIPAYFRGVDCVVCASRDDPLPVFITEGMMFGKVTICSEHTGTALIMRDGVNGYVYKDDSAEELAEKLDTVAAQFDNMDALRQQSRATYEQYFTMDVFRRNLLALVEEMLP